MKGIVTDQEVLRFLAAPAGDGLSNPVWSPDGKQIAFVEGTSDDKDRPLIFYNTVLVMRPDGSHLRVLYGPTDDLLTVDWSPDGKKLLLCGQHVRTRPTTGGPTTDLTPSRSYDCNTASWQPR
jgi:Tol biopolymer transport system component